MPTDLTDEQREAAFRAIRSVPQPSSPGRILNALLALGWRAPGPPTEAEVEAGAIALYLVRNNLFGRTEAHWHRMPDSLRLAFWFDARAALSAALAPGEMKEETDGSR